MGGGGADGEDDTNPDPDPNIAVPDAINIPPIVQVTEAMPIAKAGVALAAVLDGLDVENNWLPGKSVNWKTGKVVEDSESGPASNAGAFVAALCNRMKVPMLAVSDTGVWPTDQYEWLIDAGKRKHWMKVGEAEAQFLANQGWVVIAARKNMAEPGERSIAGQTAIVRPDSQPVGELHKRGPNISMAGFKNYKNISIKDGFPEEAWKKYEIVYLAHQIR